MFLFPFLLLREALAEGAAGVGGDQVDEQVFIDGIGGISIIGGTVRLDLIVYSATEKDSKGHPALAFRQRLVIGADNFLRAAEKIQETAAALQRISQPPRPRPVVVPDSEPVDPVTLQTSPLQPSAEVLPAELPPASRPSRPFP